jgi:hypothetical protein
MIYVCQLLCDKGWELPRWQKAFGHRFVGELTKTVIQDDETRRWTLAAFFRPLPFAEAGDGWPRPLVSITEHNEDREARYIEGMELNKSVQAERYLRQVWKLTLVPAKELAEIEAKLAAPQVVADPEGRPPLYK